MHLIPPGTSTFLMKLPPHCVLGTPFIYYVAFTSNFLIIYKKKYAIKNFFNGVGVSVSNVVEFPWAGLSRLITIVSELNVALYL